MEISEAKFKLRDAGGAAGSPYGDHAFMRQVREVVEKGLATASVVTSDAPGD